MISERKRVVAICATIFVTLEIAAIVIGVWPLLGKESDSGTRKTTIRMGISPEYSIAVSDSEWQPILLALSDSEDLRIDPCYVPSIDDAVTGFSQGSLDIIKVSPTVFRELEKTNDAVALVLDGVGAGSQGNRAVLVCRRDSQANYIQDTRGMRLTYVDRLSTTGFVAANQLFLDRLSTPPEEWFQSISFAGTHHQALINLLRNDTDLIAIGQATLQQCMKRNGLSSDQIRVLWVSHDLLPDVYCCHSRVGTVFRQKIVREFLAQSADNAEDGLRFLPLELEVLDTWDRQTDAAAIGAGPQSHETP